MSRSSSFRVAYGLVARTSAPTCACKGEWGMHMDPWARDNCSWRAAGSAERVGRPGAADMHVQNVHCSLPSHSLSQQAITPKCNSHRAAVGGALEVVAPVQAQVRGQHVAHHNKPHLRTFAPAEGRCAVNALRLMVWMHSLHAVGSNAPRSKQGGALAWTQLQFPASPPLPPHCRTCRL